MESLECMTMSTDDAEATCTGESLALARSMLGRHAANVRHSKKNGAKEKHAKLISAWNSGKYSSRNKCAEEESAALGMSFSAARRVLIGK